MSIFDEFPSMSRISQRDLLPVGVQRRNQVVFAKSYTATIARSTGGDFNNFQNALDFVNSLGGGTVFVKTGTYIITDNIRLYSNITLIGESKTGTILDFNNTTYQIIAKGISNGRLTNINIENLTIQNGANTSTGTIYTNFVNYIKIENVNFSTNRNLSSNLGFDIYSDTCGFTDILHCSSANSGSFLYIDNNDQLFNVIGNRTIPTYQHAIAATGANGALGVNIENNTFAASKKSFINGAFRATGIINNFMLTAANVAGSTDHGIVLISSATANATSNRIVGNYIADVSGTNTDIINLDASVAGSVAQNVISGNTINQVTRDGIRLVSADQNVITGNFIAGGTTGTAYGVNISNAASDNNLVVGNVITANTADTNDAGTGSTIANNN